MDGRTITGCIDGMLGVDEAPAAINIWSIPALPYGEKKPKKVKKHGREIDTTCALAFQLPSSHFHKSSKSK